MAVGSGGTGRAGAVRAGRAFVELSTKDDGLRAGLARAGKMIKSWGAGIAAAGAALIGLGGSVLGPIIASFKSAVGRMSEFFDASQRLGATTEDLSELGYAAELTGNSFEDVASAAAIMQKNLVESPDTFKAIGLEAAELRKLGMADQFQAIADALQNLDEESQTAAARGIFGRGGARLIGMFKELEKLRRRARLVGAIVSKEDAEAADRMGDALEDLGFAFKYSFQSIGAALLPYVDTIESLTDLTLSLLKGFREWIKANSALVLGITAVSAAIVVLGAVGVATGTALIIVGMALNAVMTIAAALASPLFLIGAGFAATAVAGVLWGMMLAELIERMLSGQSAATVLGKSFEGLGRLITSTFKSVTDALKSGDIELAWEIVLASMTYAWKQFIDNVAKDLPKLGLGPAIIAKNMGDTAKDALDAMNKLTALQIKAMRGAVNADAERAKRGMAAREAIYGPTRGTFAGRGASAELARGGMSTEEKQLKELQEINKGVKDLKGGGIPVD